MTGGGGLSSVMAVPSGIASEKISRTYSSNFTEEFETLGARHCQNRRKSLTPDLRIDFVKYC